MHSSVMGQDLIESLSNHLRSSPVKQARKARPNRSIIPKESLIPAVKTYGAAYRATYGTAYGAAYGAACRAAHSVA